MFLKYPIADYLEANLLDDRNAPTPVGLVAYLDPRRVGTAYTPSAEYPVPDVGDDSPHAGRESYISVES